MCDKKIYRDIGKRIKAIRVLSNITQGELCLKLGIGRATLVQIELGNRPIKVHELVKVAGVLDIEINDVINGITLQV